MLDQQLSVYLRNTIPEFINATIKIGNFKLRLSEYDYINALIAHNNIVDGARENIAIFHPEGDLLDIIFLVMAGLSSYKESALKNSNLKPDDLVPGTFVEYEGKIARYIGHRLDARDGIDKFELAYDDPLRSRRIAPIEPCFKNVSKYSGDRLATDRLDRVSKKIDKRKEAISSLFNMGDRPVNLADYAAFLVCSARPDIIDILRETSINAAPFFKIFPSVKCNSNGIGRITRDLKKRRPVFYFSPSLSVADDILREQKSITALIVDGKKATNSGSLLSSIRSDYGIEDIYLMEDFSKISSAYELSSNLGFKVWAWTPSDFKFIQLPKADKRFKYRQEVQDQSAFFEHLVERKNRLLEKLSRYQERVIELSYPGVFDQNKHNHLIEQLLNIRSYNKTRNDPAMAAFLLGAYGIMNRIFQGPLPGSISDISEHLKNLEANESQFLRSLPQELQGVPGDIISGLREAAQSFAGTHLKADMLVELLIRSGKNKCILVKRADEIEPLRVYIASKIPNGDDICITSSTRRIGKEFDSMVWMFRPNFQQYSSFSFKTGESIFLLYNAQRNELDQVKIIFSQNLSKYAEPSVRASILKFNLEHQEDGDAKLNSSRSEIFDLDELLFTKATLPGVYGKRYAGENMVSARQVLFENGFMSFFSKGHRISVLGDTDVEEKNIESLKIGDQVIFLKNERRTIFEETMDYFSHKPEILATVEIASAWHRALANFSKRKNLSPEQVRMALKEGGLERGISTIENWIEGETICPFEQEAIDVIASVTEDEYLKQNIDKIKSAGKVVHGLHIRIGRYLARQVTQSLASSDRLIEDPVLMRKLNEISSFAEIINVAAMGSEDLEVSSKLVNKLLAPEDL